MENWHIYTNYGMGASCHTMHFNLGNRWIFLCDRTSFCVYVCVIVFNALTILLSVSIYIYISIQIKCMKSKRSMRKSRKEKVYSIPKKTASNEKQYMSFLWNCSCDHRCARSRVYVTRKINYVHANFYVIRP